MLLKQFIMSILLFTFSFAEDLESVRMDNSLAVLDSFELETFQKYLSDKVIIFSSNLDRSFSSDPDENGSNRPVVFNDKIDKDTLDVNKAEETFALSSVFDDFFKNETYLDITNRSYIKVHGGYEYNKRGDSDFLKSVSARIRLPKTQKKLQLFFGGESDEDNEQFTLGHRDKGIGLKYYLNSLSQGLFANAAIGMSGISNPYLKTHVQYPMYFQKWLFRPMQTVRYSRRDSFDEWTDFYVDRKISDSRMVRLLLQRSTNSEIKGMDYMSQISYLSAYGEDTSYSYYAGMNGRTKDLSNTSYKSGLHPQEGIYSYTVGATWRKRLWKDYFFYQIDPILSFHEEYNYKPNYIFRVSIDIYFGNNK